MKLDTTTVLTGLTGDPIIDTETIPRDGAGKATGPGQPLTLGTVIIRTMLVPQRGDETVTAEQKLKDFKIAEAALQPEAEYDVDQRARIKDRASRLWTTEVFGRLVPLLDA